MRSARHFLTATDLARLASLVRLPVPPTAPPRFGGRELQGVESNSASGTLLPYHLKHRPDWQPMTEVSQRHSGTFWRRPTPLSAAEHYIGPHASPTLLAA